MSYKKNLNLESIENQLNKRKSSENKPLGGVDISGGDRTQAQFFMILNFIKINRKQKNIYNFYVYFPCFILYHYKV